MPEGLTLASIVLAAGGRTRHALGAVTLIGLATVLGTLLTNALTGRFGYYALALSGGITLYVAASDLVPEVIHSRDSRSLPLMFSGVAIYWFTDHLLRAAGLR
jgi:zinc and cadmium transporter